MKNLLILLLFFVILQQNAFSQSGIRLNSEEALPSLTLINIDKTYLIDNCGFIVNQWDTYTGTPHPKLLKNGNLMVLKNSDIIVELDWEGETVIETKVNLPSDYYLSLIHI